MCNITTCKVVNKFNDNEIEEFVVGTEWDDSSIKVLIIKKDNTLLAGEIALQDFNKYAKTFNKEIEIYLKETKDILSGINNDIQFFLRDNKFYWKKERFALGQVILKPVAEIECLTNFTLLLIDHYLKIKKDAFDLEKDKESLKSRYCQLNDKLTEIVKLKEQLETALYKRFTVVLNAKKAKIRELKSKLEKLENNKDSIFNETTDESENESAYKDNEVSSSNSKCISIKKRLLEEETHNNIEEKRRKSETVAENNVISKDAVVEKDKKVSLQKDVEPVASTSTHVIISKDEETPDFLTEESECELELQDEEEVEDEKKDSICAIAQEESEEEMF